MNKTVFHRDMSHRARQHMARLLYSKVCTSVEKHGVDPRIFGNEDIEADLSALDEIEFRVSECVFGDEAEDTHVKVEEEVAPDLSPAESMDVDTPDIVRHIGESDSKWDQALIEEGIQQGSGESELHPLVIGGRNSHDPPIEPLDIDVSSNLSKSRVNDIQKELYEGIMSIVYPGMKNFKPTYVRLHPWAANTMVNLFTGNILGRKALQKLNFVLAAFSKTENRDPAGPQRALELASDETLTNFERTFYGSLSVVIEALESGDNAYRKFLLDYKLRDVHVQLQQIEREIKMHPGGLLAQSVGRHARQGVNRHDRVIEALADRMGWEPKKLSGYVQRTTKLAECSDQLTICFLLITGDSVESW